MLLIDFNNMLSQAPYAEEPRAELILNGTPHLYAPDRPLSFGMRYPPPWNAMNTISDYRATAVESSDEMPDLLRDGSRCLAVPDNIRSRGGTRRSFSTVQTPYTASSDGRNDLIQERTETRRGGRQPGSRLPEAGLENVRQVRNAGACIRCRMLKMRVSSGTVWTIDSFSVSDSSSVQVQHPAKHATDYRWNASGPAVYDLSTIWLICSSLVSILSHFPFCK